MTHFEFNEKLVNYNRHLKGFALSLTSNKPDADDLLQETYLRALRYKDRYENRNSFKSWIFTIMKNTFINNYRKKKRQGDRMDVEDGEKFSAYSSMDTERKITMNEMNSLVYFLDNKLRIPLQLYVEGYKYEEIAQKMNTNIGTIKSRIFMARKKLKSYKN